MLERIKRLFTGNSRDEKTTGGNEPQTTPCRSCGKLITCDPSGKEKPEYCPECKAGARAEQGRITRKCEKCGKTFSLPEEVQHWPNYCQECRRKYHIVEQITRTCRGCGKEFTFPSNLWHWPNYCRDCQSKRKSRR